MRIVSYIYSGFYYLYADSKLSNKPSFSAWAGCTLSSIFYIFALLIVVGKFYDDRYGEDAFPFGVVAIILAILIALLSDWDIQYTWFGARKVEMFGIHRSRAKMTSLAVLLGSWLAFISVGFITYA
tara:strand:- start:127 stop:504 length:378 start_codon:yes stop_codon:yes gene_type:complete